MPLRCLDHADHSLDAVALDPAAWATLTVANRRDRHLRMHCCGSSVVLKTSRLGTRFFAHHVLGGCASGDESPEHLHLKTLAIAAARAAGWSADAEVSGVTPDGEPWRADVLATRGRHRVAVEVQWSGQADDETARRQARYAASGVRALWLFRRPGFAVNADVPAVRVRGTLAAGLTVLRLPAADFLTAVFEGRLKFGIPNGVTAHLTFQGVVAQCWGNQCGALNRALKQVTVAFGTTACDISLSELGRHPLIADQILNLLPSDRARGRIKPRYSKTQDRTYLANGCLKCDRLLGEFFLTDLNSRFTIAITTILIDEHWRTMIDASSSYDPVWSVVAPSPAIP